MTRRSFAIVAVLVGGACVGSAQGQTGILYRLRPESTLTAEHCLPPCMCPMGAINAPIGGTFTLTRIGQTPLFTQYSVTSVNWVASFTFAATFIRGEGEYRIGGEVALQHEMDLRLVVSDGPGPEPFSFQSGLVPVDPSNPFPRIGITTQSEQRSCTRYTAHIVAAPIPCQVDCDASGVLTGNDFQCFLDKFAAGDPYANCDGSTAIPKLTANDFQCYLNAFAAGCS